MKRIEYMNPYSTKIYYLKHHIIAISVSVFIFSYAFTQFRDDFTDDSLTLDPRGINGWTFYAGDGAAVINFSQSGKGYAAIIVDATKDKRNVWWALIRRCVSKDMNLDRLSNPKYEFRIETRIRVSLAPRRVNLHLNTQRTTDFHTHLMEFEIPDTVNWHTISMTTHHFHVIPGDTVYGQLALMDWGSEKYRVDMDYFKVDIVNVDSVGPDQGIQVPYHPPIVVPTAFKYHIPVTHDGIIDKEYPDMKFNNWYSEDDDERTNLLTVGGTQIIIMRWDLSEFTGKRIIGSGLLEFTTYSLERSSDYKKDFGIVRIVEIKGGDPQWDQKDVTCTNFCQGKPLDAVLNQQMIIDIDVSKKRGDKNLVTIPHSVLQRLIDGKTRGLAILPVGAISASFYAKENQNGKLGAKLHINLSPDSSGSIDVNR